MIAASAHVLDADEQAPMSSLERKRAIAIEHVNSMTESELDAMARIHVALDGSRSARVDLEPNDAAAHALAAVVGAVAAMTSTPTRRR